MTMIDLGIKRRSEKLLRRIQESTTTKLFILTSILQAIIVIALEARVYFRNDDASRILVDYALANSDMGNCIAPSLLRLNNIIEENIIFIIFQIFQMWLCFNAIYNQNTIQIVTIATINFFCACFGIVQMFEVQKWYGDVGKTCPRHVDVGFRPNYGLHDTPLVATLMIFGFIMGFLSWKLYRQFGWNIYKKIGGDLNKQAMFRTYLIYVMLLKLGLFFILGAALEACTVFKINLRIGSDSDAVRHIRYLPRPFYLFHIGVSVLIIANQIIGYRSVRKELKMGMRFVCAFWVVTIIDFCILLYYSIGNVRDSWYFFILFIVVGITTTIFSLIWSIFVHNNFGKGLLDFFDQKSSDGIVLPQDNSGQKRFSIED